MVINEMDFQPDVHVKLTLEIPAATADAVVTVSEVLEKMDQQQAYKFLDTVKSESRLNELELEEKTGKHRLGVLAKINEQRKKLK